MKKLYIPIILIAVSVITHSCKKDTEFDIKTPDTSVDLNIFNSEINYGTVSDIDGNTYKTVEIEGFTWMAENLRVTKFNDGTPIERISNPDSWSATNNPAWDIALGEEGMSSLYGYHYNGYVVRNSKNVCPTGWVVPTFFDMWIFSDLLIDNGYNYDGSTTGNKIAKSLASQSILWEGFGFGSFPSYSIAQNISANNKTGFSALPSGLRQSVGQFASGYFAMWTSSASTNQNLNNAIGLEVDEEGFIPWDSNLNWGLSIRCLKE